ncbi:nucleotide-sugar transporter-domain-containing protein [Gorgonomyces haynaldii]|nr:nucleotide-sugar transporter-domain-containing protein [Gorgonomyces haynaldii]
MSQARNAFLAFVGLTIIQVGFGVVYKFASSSGKYGFSQASSIAMAEFVKLCMSIGFYYQQNPLSPLQLFKKWIVEVPYQVRLGMVFLSVMYLVNNHLAFFLYTISDPGTIHLIKSSSSVISALILWFFVGRITSKQQWIAIVIQMCGLVVTQYDDCKGQAQYGISVYLAIFANTVISATSGCLNDYISKSSSASLHAINVWLYSSGCLMNIGYYFYQASVNPEEPGFFEGYQGWAIGVLMLNSLMGIAITAVYKYADAVVKTFASSTATAALLIISMIIFGTSLRVTAGFACIVIFVATYLYMTGGVAQPKPVKDKDDDNKEERQTLISPAVQRKSKIFYYVIVVVLIGTLIFFSSARDYGRQFVMNGEEVGVDDQAAPLLRKVTKVSSGGLSAHYEACLAENWPVETDTKIRDIVRQACVEYQRLHPEERSDLAQRMGAIAIASRDSVQFNKYIETLTSKTKTEALVFSSNQPSRLRNTLQLLTARGGQMIISVIYESNGDNKEAYDKVLSEFSIRAWDSQVYGGFYPTVMRFLGEKLDNVLVLNDQTWIIRPFDLDKHAAVQNILLGERRIVTMLNSFSTEDNHAQVDAPSLPHLFLASCTSNDGPQCNDNSVFGSIYPFTQLKKEWESMQIKPTSAEELLKEWKQLDLPKFSLVSAEQTVIQITGTKTSPNPVVAGCLQDPTTFTVK